MPPKSLHPLMKLLKQGQWTSAMRNELLALQRNETWFLVPLPPNKKAIRCKWLFKIKENLDGTVNRDKARLVAKGFHQIASLTSMRHSV